MLNNNDVGKQAEADWDCPLLHRKKLHMEAFTPITYNLELLGTLEKLIAPPYDVVTPREREMYASLHPFNIVHILLPKGFDEKSDEDAYRRAGATVRKWFEENILVESPPPSVFPYKQSFKDSDGREVEQIGIIVTLQLRHYETRVVRPHEMTTYSPKLDRLMLLRATRLEMSQVYALFVDDSGIADELIKGAIKERKEWLSVTDSDGVTHSLWRVNDEEWLSELYSTLENSWVLIADGHHRYETSIDFLKELSDEDLNDTHPACYIGAALANIHGRLTILPTHRLLHFRSEKERENFEASFTRLLKLHGSVEEINLTEAFRSIREGFDGDTVNFVMVCPNRILLLKVKANELSEMCSNDVGNRRELLRNGVNTVALHELLLPMVLKECGISSEPCLSYTQDAKAAVEAVRNDSCTVSILLSPLTTAQLRLAAELGERLPPKSTYFYPKIPSGLIMRLI
ncbi:MAG: hypothetical protein RUDDFDWM_001077 [Candidatus Fervidibacterota bacterium]